MSLLQALGRPVSLGAARGLGRVARQAQAHTPSATSRMVCWLDRVPAWEAVAVRWCSGPTFRPNTFIAGVEEMEELGKDQTAQTAPDALTKPDQDPHSLATSENFLLPSHKERQESDLLVAKVKEAESVAVALEVYQRHSEVMEKRHCLALLGRLAELRNKSTEEQAQPLEEEEVFQALCSRLLKQCRRMEVEEWIHLLKQLCLLHVPATAKLTQTVLQMLKSQINDLSLKQLIFLEFLLKKMTLTPLSDALLTAIPILASNTLLSSSQTSSLTFPELSKAFSICCLGGVPGAGPLLQEMYQRGSVSSVGQAMSVVWTLTDIAPPRLQRKLLSQEEQLTREVMMKECLDTLAREAESLSPRQIESTHSKVCNGYDQGDRSCYNERFLHAVASYIIRHAMPFPTAVHAIAKMMKMNYMSEELVHYTAQLMLSHPEEVPEARVPMLPLLSTITATTLSQQHLDTLLPLITSHKSLVLDNEFYKKPLMLMALDLLSVGHYYPPLVELLTSPDTLILYMSRFPKDSRNYRWLVELDQGLGVLVHSPHRVPGAFLEQARKLAASQAPTRSSLKAMLNQVLPDTNCLLSGAVTEAGIYIDHLLVLDAEGLPVTIRVPEALVDRNPSLSSLDLPPNTTKVAVLDIGSSGSFRPASVLKGQWRLRQKVLEAAGYKVVVLLQTLIFQHRDEEKILYVKRELSEAGVNLS